MRNGPKIVDQATADTVTARAVADRLQWAADTLAGKLKTSEACGNFFTAAASKAAARAAVVLAKVLKRADQRAGEQTEDVDEARALGLTCKHSYDGVAKTPD